MVRELHWRRAYFPNSVGEFKCFRYRKVKPLEVNQQAVRKELDIVLGCLGKELLERSIQVLSEIAGQGFVVAERPPDLRRQFRVGREMLRECEVVLEASVGLIDQVGDTRFALALGHDGIPFGFTDGL